MKKIIFVILVWATAILPGSAGNSNGSVRNSETSAGSSETSVRNSETSAGSRERTTVNTRRVISAIRDYRYEPGFEVVSVGKFWMGLTRIAAGLAVETEEERRALSILNNIDKIVVVEYEDASEAKRREFDSRLSRLLDRAEKIVEVKDEEDILYIYGTSVNDAESIDDLMIYIPEDCTLICILGSISAEKIADLIKMANE